MAHTDVIDIGEAESEADIDLCGILDDAAVLAADITRRLLRFQQQSFDLISYLFQCSVSFSGEYSYMVRLFAVNSATLWCEGGAFFRYSPLFRWGSIVHCAL